MTRGAGSSAPAPGADAPARTPVGAEATERPERLARLWQGYSEKVYGDYSPLNATIAAVVAGSPELLSFVAAQPPHAHDPNMLLAGMQYLVLSGRDHPLTARYTAAAGGAVAFGEAVGAAGADRVRDEVVSFCRAHREELGEIMVSRRIQTNEVGRSAGLALGLRCAAQILGEPIGLVDAGASAGLNLLLDQYHLGFSTGKTLGPPDSPVVIDCRVEPPGLRLPDRLPHIRSRAGLDRSPVDLGDPDNVRWLLACIWPGTGRQDRARAAMELAAARPVPVLAGDMIADLPRLVDEVGEGPTAVMTSWSFSYLAPGDRRAFEAALGAAGERRPIAWVCCDAPGVTDLFPAGSPPPDGADIPSVLGLAVFDGGGVRAHTLGYMHSHGAWVHWLDEGMTPEP